MTAPRKLLLAAAATATAAAGCTPPPPAGTVSPTAAISGGEQAVVVIADPPRPRPRRIPRATRSRVRTAPARTKRVVRAPGSQPPAPGRGFTAWAQSRATFLVFRCESHWNPHAVNPSGKYRGLAQMDAHFWAKYGGLDYAPRPDLATALEQLHVAYRGWLARGWEPWSCSRLVGVL